MEIARQWKISSKRGDTNGVHVHTYSQGEWTPRRLVWQHWCTDPGLAPGCVLSLECPAALNTLHIAFIHYCWHCHVRTSTGEPGIAVCINKHLHVHHGPHHWIIEDKDTFKQNHVCCEYPVLLHTPWGQRLAYIHHNHTTTREDLAWRHTQLYREDMQTDPAI